MSSRRRVVGSLILDPPLHPDDVGHVAAVAADDGVWAPCAEGCCLLCVAPEPGHVIKAAPRRLMRDALGIAGVRLVDGALAVHDDAGDLVVLTVGGNRITHRVAARRPGPGHPAAPHAPVNGEGGGQVIPIVHWR